jgi:hypothetical protein
MTATASFVAWRVVRPDAHPVFDNVRVDPHSFDFRQWIGVAPPNACQAIVDGVMLGETRGTCRARTLTSKLQRVALVESDRTRR